MIVECPNCKKEIDVSMPDTASEGNEIDCECGAVLEVGWYATGEVRNWKMYLEHEEEIR